MFETDENFKKKVKQQKPGEEKTQAHSYHDFGSLAPAWKQRAAAAAAAASEVIKSELGMDCETGGSKQARKHLLLLLLLLLLPSNSHIFLAYTFRTSSNSRIVFFSYRRLSV